MSQTVTNLSTLKINYLTSQQYQDALDAGTINPNELYLTPASGRGSTVTVEPVLVSGTQVATISIDGAPYILYAPTPPTKTSDLTNDSNFVADANYVHTDNNFTTTEKNKLGNIAAGAEVNVQSDWSVTSSTSDAYIKNKPSIPQNTSDLTNDSDFVSDASYVHTDNNYTTTEKNKLSGIASGAEVNVQSDWNVTTTTSDAYIKNKPSIPTATSDLTNDSNFVSDASYVHTDNNYTTDEKSKLSGIATGAEVNQNAFSTVKVGTTSLAADSKTDTLTITAGDNITLTPAASSDSFVIAATDTTYSVVSAGTSTTAGGLMSQADKTKLNGIATGAEVNVQSNWNETSTSSDAYILNKPTIPTKVSQLSNDSGYITGYTETDPVFSSSAAADITSTDITNWNSKADASDIPTATSDLTNDSNFVADNSYVHTDNNYTTTEKNKLSGIASGAEVNVQSDWSVTSTSSDAYIKNKPTIPSKTSDLTNDSDFVADSSYVHTDNNYTTSEKSKLNGIVAGAEVNVQSNWTETSTTSDAYIQNKPTINKSTVSATAPTGATTGDLWFKIVT